MAEAAGPPIKLIYSRLGHSHQRITFPRERKYSLQLINKDCIVKYKTWAALPGTTAPPCSRRPHFGCPKHQCAAPNSAVDATNNRSLTHGGVFRAMFLRP